VDSPLDLKNTGRHAAGNHAGHGQESPDTRTALYPSTGHPEHADTVCVASFSLVRTVAEKIDASLQAQRERMHVPAWDGDGLKWRCIRMGSSAGGPASLI
jgi:hypothetical protein